jgi:hypothetical protein
MRTPQQCEQAARTMTPKDEAFAFLRACVARADFDDLRPLLREPWLSELKRRGIDGLMIAAAVAARRDQDYWVDLTLLRDHGLQIWHLERNAPRPEEYEGKVVMFRARLEPRDPSGFVARELVFGLRSDLEPYVYRHGSFATIRQKHVDRRDKTSATWKPSGRELGVNALPASCAESIGREQMIVTKVLELRIPSDTVGSDPGELPEQQARGHGSLLGCFPTR